MTIRQPRNSRPTWLLALLVAAFGVLGVSLWLGLEPERASSDEPQLAAEPELVDPARAQTSKSRIERAEPRTIAVAVVDRSDAPIPSARVCLAIPARSSAEQRCVTTDSAGLADGLEVPSGERWRIGVSAAGYRPASIPRLGELEPSEGLVRVILTPGGSRIAGRIEDATGGVIEGAFVSVVDAGEASFAAAHSGPGGEFELWAAQGQVVVRAVAEGYAASEERLIVPSGPVVLRLLPESVIAGKVLDAETREPIADALVIARRSDDDGQARADERFSVRSDAAGGYRIAGMSAGAFQVTSQGPWGYGTSEGAIVLEFAERREDVDILVHRGSTVLVEVVVRETGQGCPGANLRLTQEDIGLAIAATTDGSGRVELSLPIAGEYQVAVDCAGHRPVEQRQSVRVSGVRDDRSELRVEVEQGLTLRGQVLDESGSKPIPDALVAVISTRATTPAATAIADHEGRFELTGLDAGKYVALASAPGWFPLDTPTESTLPSEDELEVRLRPGAALVGRVVEQGGSPALEARVLVQRHASNGRFRGETIVDEAGRFVFEHLPPGDYGVDVIGATGQSLVDPERAEAVHATVKVEAGGRSEVEFVVAARDGAITGRVVAADGEPLSSAFVCAEPSEPARGALPRQRCAAKMTELDGSFEIRNLQPDRYTLSARVRGGGEARQTEVAPGDRVELVVHGTGEITGKAHYSSDGRAPDMLVVEVVRADAQVRRREAFLRSQGRWSITGLPAGDYAIRVHASAGAGVAEAEVEAEGEVDVGDVALDDRTMLSGRVVRLETSAPLAGFRVVATSLAAQMRSRYTREDARNVSDDQGHFVVSDPPTGRVTLHVIPENLDARPPDLTEAHLTVTVDPGNPLEVGDLAIPSRRVQGDEPRASFGFTLARWDHVGDQAEQDGRVEAIVSGGPAERAGLQVGDVITAIDGYDVIGRRYVLQYRLIAPIGTSVTLDTERAAGVVIQGE
ncbi:carboxypeptidase regulatory-like domain-containing protein [Nannocystaceae bacterium ST9]